MSKKSNDEFYPVALTVAGSDSGGGAGIQADLRTFNAFGVFGCSAITAVTSQNPLEVRRIDALGGASVKTQLDTVLDKIAVRWVKSGMLADAETVRVVAETVRARRLLLVCDPVMVSTSGAELLDPDAADAVKRELLPVAKWITPNLPEAEKLLGIEIRSFDDCADAARRLFEQSGASVLLKTGHASFGDTADDVICREGKLYILSAPRIEIPPCAAHGTGCTLSAALAAAFAAGASWKQAVCEAKAFVLGSLSENACIGPDIFAMYPPVADFSSQVTLKPPAGAAQK